MRLERREKQVTIFKLRFNHLEPYHRDADITKAKVGDKMIIRPRYAGIIALMYTLLPNDIIPDSIPMIGFLDDAIMYFCALSILLMRFYIIKNRR